MGLSDVLFNKITLFFYFLVTLGVLGVATVYSLMARTQLDKGNTALAKEYTDKAAMAAGITWGILVIGTFVFVIKTIRDFIDERKIKSYKVEDYAANICRTSITKFLKGKGVPQATIERMIDKNIIRCTDVIKNGGTYPFTYKNGQEQVTLHIKYPSAHDAINPTEDADIVQRAKVAYDTGVKKAAEQQDRDQNAAARGAARFDAISRERGGAAATRAAAILAAAPAAPAAPPAAPDAPPAAPAAPAGSVTTAYLGNPYGSSYVAV